MARRRPGLLGVMAAAACSAALALAAPAAGVGGPTVTIDAPTGSPAVCGSVPVSATPTPDPDSTAPAITGVDFTFAGGAPVTTTGPYSTTWDSTTATDGAATITATASDGNGPGPTTSEQVTVVNSPHVTVSSPTSGQTVGDSVTVTTGSTYLGVAVTGVSASVGGETPVALSSGGSGFSGPVPVSDLHGSQTLTLSVAIGSCTGTQTVPITVTHPPQVSFTNPGSGATVSGSVSLAATASATGGRTITGVSFYLDDTSHLIAAAALGSGSPTSGTWNATWNSLTASDASHTILVVATDNQSVTTQTSEPVTVSNGSDSVSISTPTTGSTVSGTVTITATASTGGATVSSLVLLDGAATLQTCTSTPCTFQWNTAGKNGDHTLTAKLTDSFGRTKTSTGVLVHVANPPTASVTAPANASTVSGTAVPITVTATADASTTVAQVQIKLDGTVLGIATATATPGQYSLAWNSTLTADGSHAISAHVTDGKGLTVDSGSVSVTVSNGSDSVSISAPTNGSTVSGTVTITAVPSTGAATLTSLTLLDGPTTLQTFTTAPYTFGWNTAGKNGDHTLTAKVTDSFGRTATSTGVLVHVANLPTAVVTTPPSPLSGKSVAITVTATADASTTVSSVQVKVDGAVLGLATPTGSAGHYSITWDSTKVTDGPHAIVAHVTDGKGLAVDSAADDVTVSNGADTVSISAPASGSTVTGTVTITAVPSTGTSGAAVTQVTLFDGTTPLHSFCTTTPTPSCPATFSYDWNTAGHNGSHTLSATVADDASRAGSGPSVVVTVANLPTVAVTSPAAGDTVSGLAVPIEIHATADASTHVASVSVLLDGNPLAAAAPKPGSDRWDVAWDTSGANGSHTLLAHVTDANGLARDSDPVAITVANPGPSVALPSLPEGGAVARGQVSEPIVVSPNEATGKAVTAVTAVADDGTNVIVTSAGAGHWTASWNTSRDLGPHVFTVTATDAGHVTTVLARHVTVTADDSLNVLVPSVRQWNQRFTVGAALRLSDGAPLNNRAVQLQIRPSGTKSWSALGVARTDAHGVAAFSVTLTRAAQFRAVFGGEAGVRPVTSADTDVNIAPVVTLRIPITAKLGHTNRGTVTVRGPKGTIYVIQLIARKGTSATSLGSARVTAGRVTPIHLRITQHGTYVIRVTCSTGRGQPAAVSNSVTVRA